MILIDTSIWIDHLRGAEDLLAPLLHQDNVCTHAMIIGELACGNLANRKEILELLNGLPRLASATDAEVLQFMEQHRLMGRGIGYIDAHLLSAAAMHRIVLWTRDKKLQEIAQELGLNHANERH